MVDLEKIYDELQDLPEGEKLDFLRDLINSDLKVSERSMLRVLMAESTNSTEESRISFYKEVVHDISSSCESVSDEEALMLCFSLVKLHLCDSSYTHPSGVEQILRAKYDLVKTHFPESKYPFLHPKDARGKPPPPRARVAAPPREDGQLQHQIREPRRALPGYTTGEMAAEYARKHKL